MEQHKLLSSQVSLTGFESVDDHIEYRIEVTWGERPWLVWKRYKDFAALDARLEACYGKRQVPHLTSSHVGALMKGNSTTFLKRRAQKLEQYLRHVVEYIDHWALVGSSHDVGVGWGTVLGINQFLFDFFEIGTKAIMPAPKTAVIKGTSVISASDIERERDALFEPPSKEDATRFASENDLDTFLKVLNALPSDEDRLYLLERDLPVLTKQGQVGLNCVQATAMIRTLYFGDSRVKAIREIVGAVIDVRMLEMLLDAFDFEEDEAVVRLLFAGKV